MDVPVTRCKFVVDEITVGKRWTGTAFAPVPTRIRLSAVTPDRDRDGFAHDENHAFWNATPSGLMEIQVQNARAAELFQAGDQFYLDFVPVPTAEA